MTATGRRRPPNGRRPARGDPSELNSEPPGRNDDQLGLEPGLAFRRGRWLRRERGMVTAEIAAALPALALVMVAAVWAVAVATTQLRCADAAREAARAAARGEDLAVVRQVAEEVAPDDVDIEIDHSGGAVAVRVVARVPMPGPAGGSFSVPAVEGTAVAMLEAR